MQLLVTFAVFLALLIHTSLKQVVGELMVTGTISEESAVAIGFGDFVTYQFHESIQVSCRADPLPVDGILELFQDDRSLEVVEAPTLDKKIKISSIDLGGNSERRIIFSCRLRVGLTRDPLALDRASYVVEHSFRLTLRHIDLTTPVNLCASSIGSSGTLRESSNMFCATSLDSNTIQLMWSGQDPLTPTYYLYNGIGYTFSSVQSSLFGDPMICYNIMYEQPPREVCRLPDFEIISQPNVTISPETFPDSLESVSFTCQSNPPSRIRWEVRGDLGDILDLDLIANLPDGEWTVRIKEMAGTSTMILAGGAVTFLNISTVICVTYGRQYTKIGVSQRGTNPDVTPSVTISMGSNDTFYIIVITILVVSTLILAVSCSLLYLRRKRTSKRPDSASTPFLEVMDVISPVQNVTLYQKEPADENCQTPSL